MALNNENNNNCCKCTTPEYELILNEQGPQGRRGEKGDAGFTPIISVKDNTDSNYTLNILTQDGQITTPNLKANLPAGGATGQVLTKNSGEQDDCSWQNLPGSTIETEGIARLATEADFEATEDTEASDNTIVTPALFNSEFKNKSAKFVTTNTEQAITRKKTFMTDIAARGDIILQKSIVNYSKVGGIKPNIIEHSAGNNNIIIGETKLFTSEYYKNLGIEIQCDNLENDAGIYTHRDGNKYLLLDSSNVTAGNNITIDKTSTGITISSTGGGVADAYTKTETDNLLDAKQDKLVATTGIEINNNNIGINQKGTSLIEYNNTNGSIGYIEDSVLHQERNVIDYIEGIAAPIIDIPDNSIHSFDISTVVKLSDYNDIEDNRILEIGGNGTNAAYFDTHAYNIKNMVRMGYFINGTGNAYWHETIQDDKYLAVRMTNDGTTLKFFTKVVDTPELPTDWNEWNNIPWDLSSYPIEKGDLPGIINIGGEVNKNPTDNIISTINIQKGLYYLNQTKVIINNTLFSYTSSNYNDAIATTENYGLVKIDGNSLTINENYQLQANIPSNLTTQGNTFNEANQLVQLDSTGKLPAIDGSQLINLPTGSSGFPSSETLTESNFNNVITEGLYYWNGYTTPQNHPDGNANGYLMVLSLSGGSTVKQVFFEANGNSSSEANNYNKMYMRVCISNSSIGYGWSNWVQLATGDMSNMVTTDTNQTITGIKTFPAYTKFDDVIQFTGDNCRIQNIYGNNLFLDNRVANTIQLGEKNRTTILSNTVQNDSGKKFLVQGSITSGSDNLVISETTDGIQIVSTNNTGNLKYWTGTEAAYTKIASKNADTLYRTTDTNKVYLGTIQIGGNA